MELFMESATSDNGGGLGAEDFLDRVGDEDFLKFFQRLPMIAKQQDGTFTLRDLIYEMKLSPFVKSAWQTIDGAPGLTGRLTQMTRVYAKAEADFAAITGATRRLPRKIDLPTFLEIYTTVGLP